MNKNLQFFLNENIQIDLENFVLNLFVAIVLCFLIQLTYNKTSRSLSNSENFSSLKFFPVSLFFCDVSLRGEAEQN